ncbi:HNH endonuclease [Tautonia rosea]|uniref:HNH endonuclease n=1 Tax=Tautonia rosea TaxID=2728037 RepID=UPI001473C5F3|nr:HNH endonuclease [Tautonia rosea]
MHKDGGSADTPRTARFASFAPTFEAALRVPEFRRAASRVLIRSSFTPPEQVALGILVGEPEPTDGEDGTSIEVARKSDSCRARGNGPSARFRIDVVAAYNYTCALTGCRLTTVTAGSLVDAAHIRQFARLGSDKIGYGLALSKDAHWAFDSGLWSLTDDCRVIVVVGCFVEECPDVRPLGANHGQQNQLPAGRTLWPNLVNLAWHRRHKLQND